MKKLLLASLVLVSAHCFSQTITPVLYPLFMQGHGTSSAGDERRTPYACRMTLSGLTPNTTYFFYNRWAVAPESPVEQGGIIFVMESGNWLRSTSPTFGSAANRGSFTTDGNGNFTGWFVSESNIATDFIPGTHLYFRIVLNDGNGGIEPATILTAADFVTVLAWDDYPLSEDPAPYVGSGVRSANTNTAWVPKNFIMLYDNQGGTGRPIAGTFIESDGSAETVANGYVPFYGNATTGINGFNNRWGTIIPDDLPNGIQRIAQYSMSNGALVSSCMDADGDWGGANGNTVNPAVGMTTPLILDCTPTGSCNITLSTTVTNVTCNGSSNGSVNLTVNGATAPVTYSWSSGATTEDLTNVAAGTFTVTVTDAASCTATASATVTQPATPLSASEQHTAISCNGGSSTVTIGATGGTAPYTGTGTFSRTAGTYSFTVTDANGCSSSVNITVNQPSPLNATATSAACVEGTSTVTVSATGGTAPYTGTGTFSRTSGTYNFTVTDANGCTASAQAIVNCAAACNITLSTGVTNVTWNGSSNGSVNLTVNGAMAPVTYNWSSGATTEDLTNVAAGTYTVTVTDAASCTATASATVTQPATPLSASEQHTSISCNGGSSTVTISATGGTSPYTGTGTFSRTAGTYSFTVTDANGCSSSVNVTVNQPSPLNATAASAACVEGTSTVTVSATGGTAPYTGTGTFSRTSGTYNFTVTDANGCTATAQAIVNCAAACNITLSTTVTNVTCNGASNGSVNLTVNGATAPVTYSWSSGATTEDLTNVAAGTFTVTVTDAASCTATASATVTQPAIPLSASEQHTAISCNGGSSTITIGATGGTAPYTGTGTFSRTAGTYSFTVTDANGCSSSVNVAVNQPSPLNATAASAACVEGTSTITVSATGGTAPYTGTGTFSRTSGTYNFTVTDANGCTAIAQAIVNCVAACNITLSTTVANVPCNGSSNGSVNLTVNGATAQVTYSWSNGATTEDLTNVAAGTYTVTVTDAASCTATASATVTQPATPLSASEQHTAISCNGGSSTVTISATGGTAPYSGTGTFSRTAGTYSLTVTDANGCSSSVNVTVNQPSPLNATAASAACVEGVSTITVSATGGTAPYTGTGTFSRTSGTYNFTVTDANGCTATTQVAVNCTTTCSLSCSINSQANTIYLGYGQQSLILTAMATGGVGNYSFSWGNAETSSSITVSPTTTTTYTVVITDQGGCSATCSIPVNVIDARCGNNSDKVVICHNGLSLCISKNAIPEHLAEGDNLGICLNPKVRGNQSRISSPALVKVYPNPAYKELIVEWNPGNDNKSDLRVYNLDGRIVMHKKYSGLLKGQWNTRQLRLDGLSQGVYFIQISTTIGQQTIKFVIN